MTANAKPDAKSLFALYHLGLDRYGQYKFRNLHDCARALGAETATLLQWLEQDRIDQDTVSRVDFNVAKWHVEAQFVKPGEAAKLVDSAWTAYRQALHKPSGDRVIHDVDYDDIWGDADKGEKS
jgi:hypothetical protein